MSPWAFLEEGLIHSCYKSLKMHKNTHKINVNHQNPKPPIFLITSLAVTEDHRVRGRRGHLPSEHHVPGLRWIKLLALDLKAYMLFFFFFISACFFFVQLSTRWRWCCLQVPINRGWSSTQPQCNRSYNCGQSKTIFIQTSSGLLSLKLRLDFHCNCNSLLI